MNSIETTAPRRHAYTGPTSPQLPEPTYAERVRTLVTLTSIATLSTMSRKCPGYPFGSLMPYALDPEGRPLFLISNMAMHTQNLKTEPRASLFVGQIAEGEVMHHWSSAAVVSAASISEASTKSTSSVHGVPERTLRAICVSDWTINACLR